MTAHAGKLLRQMSRWFPVTFGVVCLSPFLPLLLPSDTIISDSWRDYGAAHLPWREFMREELLMGRLPLWDPYLACGRPLHAAQHVSLFDPLTTPPVLACGANVGLKLSLFAHLALCVTGMYLLALRLELSRIAACYATLVMTWSGAMMGHLAEGHVAIVFQSALVPWFFLVLVDLLTAPSAMTALRLAAVGSMCALADQPQILYYTFVAGALWTGGSLCLGEAARQRRRVIRWGVMVIAIVVLIDALQLLPAIELARDGLAESGRGRVEFGATYALNGVDAARLLMPYLNGAPFAGVPQFDLSDDYHERVIYLGISAPLLTAYSLSRATTVSWQWGAALGVLLALAVAFGDSTPAYGALTNVLPGLSLFRCPGRVFGVASVPFALLAGRGLDALARGEPRAKGAGALKFLAVALSTASLLGSAALLSISSSEWRRYGHFVEEHLLLHLSVWAMLTADAVAICVLAARARLRGWAVSLPLIAVGVFDLGYFNVSNFHMQPGEPRDARLLQPANQMIRSVEASGFGNMPYDALRYSRSTRTTMRDHRLAIGVHDGGVLPGATARLYKAIEYNGAPALALAACGLAWPGSGTTCVTSNDALPRIRFVTDGNLAADTPVETITQGDIERLQHHLAPVRLVAETPRELDMEVEAPSPGWLVVADTYYPGWICRVDGHIQPIKSAHAVFRRVRLEGGRHRVRMSYEPLSFRIGAYATAAGIMLAVSLFALHFRHRRRIPAGRDAP